MLPFSIMAPEQNRSSGGWRVQNWLWFVWPCTSHQITQSPVSRRDPFNQPYLCTALFFWEIKTKIAVKVLWMLYKPGRKWLVLLCSLSSKVSKHPVIRFSYGIPVTQPSPPFWIEDKGENDDLYVHCPLGSFRGTHQACSLSHLLVWSLRPRVGGGVPSWDIRWRSLCLRHCWILKLKVFSSSQSSSAQVCTEPGSLYTSQTNSKVPERFPKPDVHHIHLRALQRMDAWAPPQVSRSKSHGKGPESYFKRSAGLLKLPGWGPMSRHQWFRWSVATLLGILGRTKVFLGQPGGIPHPLVPGPPASFFLGAHGLLHAATLPGVGCALSACPCFFFFLLRVINHSQNAASHTRLLRVPSWLLPLLWL